MAVPASTSTTSSRARAVRGGGWWALGVLEVVLAVAVVAVDLLVPTLVLLLLTTVSLAVRREGLGTLGLRRPERPGRMIAHVSLVALAWTLVMFGVVTPAVEHLAGERRDVSAFDDLQGDLPLLLTMLVLSWTLAAFGEELVYRGYLLTRAAQTLATRGRAGGITAALVSALTFGLAHTEQGVVGVTLTTLDGLLFCGLRWRYDTVWAAVLAHGLLNTFGLVAYFVAGPLPAPW